MSEPKLTLEQLQAAADNANDLQMALDTHTGPMGSGMHQYAANLRTVTAHVLVEILAELRAIRERLDASA